MVTDEMVEKAVSAALRADIIPADDPKYEGVRINEYLSYTPAEAVELGVHLTQTTEDGKPRWHGFTDIMGDEYDDTNRAILRPVIRAALEAALSAAEPVATVAEMGVGGMRVLMPHPPGSADHLPIGTKLYAAPPAPSVAVKADEIDAIVEELLDAQQDINLAANSTMNQSLCDASALIDRVETLLNRVKASALSAQVQDVAGLLDETWNAAVEQAAAIANDCVHLTPDPGTAIRTMLNGRTKLHPAAPAKQEGGTNE